MGAIRALPQVCSALYFTGINGNFLFCKIGGEIVNFPFGRVSIPVGRHLFSSEAKGEQLSISFQFASNTEKAQYFLPGKIKTRYFLPVSFPYCQNSVYLPISFPHCQIHFPLITDSRCVAV